MAIIKLGALVSGIRGTIGGTIFSANKGSLYARAWSRGSNPRSAKQSTHRSTMVSMAQSWKALSTIEKGNWDVYAALPAQELTNSLGDPYYISGFNWYVRISMNLASVGLPPVVTTPTLGIPAIPLVASLTVYQTGGSTTSRIFLNAADPDWDDYHIFKAETYNSVGTLVSSEIKKFVVIKVHGISPFVTVFQTELDALFGTVSLGQRVFVSVATQYADGRRGAVWSGYDDVRA